CKQYNSFPFTF
nr:immunoglobulin light chain junction region [Macaca mulatta]